MAQSSSARISYAQLVVPFPSPLSVISSPLFLAILCVISVLSHFFRCPSQLSCSCRNAIHSWPKSFHLALTTFGILELTSRVIGECTGERGEVTFSKMTTKCSERRLQKLSASALGYCNNFPDTQRGKWVAKVGNDSSSRREFLTS